MGDVLPIDAGNLNESKTGSYKFAASITKVADGQATLSVYGYDSYRPEDIDALQEGSVLRIHDQGDTTVTKLTVTSIDRDADNGYVTINLSLIHISAVSGKSVAGIAGGLLESLAPLLFSTRFCSCRQ